MLRKVFVAVFCACFTVLIGCGGFDSTDVLVHPDSVTTSSTFDVALMNAFIYMDSTSKVSASVTRDSLHLLIGLPASWNVLGASCVAIRNIKELQMMQWLSDELDPVALAALLQHYQASASTMSVDAALPAALGNWEFIAHDTSGEIELPVTPASAGQWKAFKAPVNIVLEKGAAADTILDIDTLMAMMGETDTSSLSMIKMLGFTVPDTIGVCMVPVAVFLKVQAGAQTGDDTLYYYTKTGTIKMAADEMQLFDVDTGDMVFQPIKVVSTMAARSDRHGFDAPAVSIFSDRANGLVWIDLGADRPSSASVDIFSLRGDLVKRLTPASPAKSVVWNGADERGNRAGAGSYIVRVTGIGGTVSKTVQLVR